MFGIACRPISSIASDLKLVEQLYCNEVLCQPSIFAAPGDGCIVDQEDARNYRCFRTGNGRSVLVLIDQSYTRDLVCFCVISAVTLFVVTLF